MIGKLVHEDARGQIYVFKINNQGYGLSINQKGAMRGGDFHPVPQYNLILQGKMKITQWIDEKDVVTIAGPNELVVIQPGIPHLFESITESVMVEWWEKDNQSEAFPRYRDEVKENIQKLTEKC